MQGEISKTRELVSYTGNVENISTAPHKEYLDFDLD